MLLALGAATAHGFDYGGAARVWLGGGIDSNPRREFLSLRGAAPYDAFGALIVSASGKLEPDWGRLRASYDFGGHKFFLVPTEDTVIQAATVDGSIALGRYFGVGIDVGARDRRGADRDYTDLSTRAYVDFVPDAKVNVNAHFGYHRFLYWARFASSSYGITAGGTANYRFTKRHSINLWADVEPRKYNATACLPLTDKFGNTYCDPGPGLAQRADTFFSVGLGYTYRGPFVVSAQYLYIDSSSNSWGETYQRHRLSANAGVRLPAEFTILATATVQFFLYPQGIYLSTDYNAEEHDENANSLSLKVLRPLGKHFDIDFKYAVYFSRLPRNDSTYLRMVGSLGVGWHW